MVLECIRKYMVDEKLPTGSKATRRGFLAAGAMALTSGCVGAAMEPFSDNAEHYGQLFDAEFATPEGYRIQLTGFRIADGVKATTEPIESQTFGDYEKLSAGDDEKFWLFEFEVTRIDDEKGTIPTSNQFAINAITSENKQKGVQWPLRQEEAEYTGYITDQDGGWDTEGDREVSRSSTHLAFSGEERGSGFTNRWLCVRAPAVADMPHVFLYSDGDAQEEYTGADGGEYTARWWLREDDFNCLPNDAVVEKDCR